jgi:hypothetical protein
MARVHEARLTHGIAALVFAALLLSALATEAIGIHAIFGAFLLGAIISHENAVARAFARKLDEVVTLLLLPAFFAFTGMRTQVALVSGLEQWLLCGLIIVVATAGRTNNSPIVSENLRLCYSKGTWPSPLRSLILPWQQLRMDLKSVLQNSFGRYSHDPAHLSRDRPPDGICARHTICRRR